MVAQGILRNKHFRLLPQTRDKGSNAHNSGWQAAEGTFVKNVNYCFTV